MPKCIPAPVLKTAQILSARTTEFCTLECNILWSLSMAFASCYPSGTYNFDMVPTFLEYLCTHPCPEWVRIIEREFNYLLQVIVFYI
jgi:hypothetical protein